MILELTVVILVTDTNFLAVTGRLLATETKSATNAKLCWSAKV